MKSLTFLLAIFFGNFSSAEQINDQELYFDFERTVAIVQPTANGHIIYQRPSGPTAYAGNFDRQGFVVLYRTLEPYLYLLQIERDIPQSPPPGNSEAALIFVNPEATQSYLIGNHWIRSWDHWVRIETNDYRELTDMLSQRMESSANPGNGEAYIERMQEKLSMEDVTPFPEFAGDLPSPDKRPTTSNTADFHVGRAEISVSKLTSPVSSEEIPTDGGRISDGVIPEELAAAKKPVPTQPHSDISSDTLSETIGNTGIHNIRISQWLWIAAFLVTTFLITTGAVIISKMSARLKTE